MCEQKESQTAGQSAGRLPHEVTAVLLLLGATAVVAQIVLMRELIVVFQGNEISLGLMLANWLLWTALGSSLAGRLAMKVSNSRHLTAGLQVLICLGVPGHDLRRAGQPEPDARDAG